jgi:hypothetical protein
LEDGFAPAVILDVLDEAASQFRLLTENLQQKLSKISTIWPKTMATGSDEFLNEL